MEKKQILAFDNFSCTVSGRQVFDHFSFSLSEGEVHCVMSGRAYDLNNMGHLLLGELGSREDNFILGGESVSFSRLRQGAVYFVTQNSVLFREMSIPVNIFLNTRMTRRAAERRTAELFAELDICLDPRTPVKALSGSQKKLVELVRAYASGARVVALYETLYHIDRTLHHQVLRIIDAFRSAGVSVVYLTSKLEDALAVSDRISLLDNGRVLEVFNTRDIRDNPYRLAKLLAGLDPDSDEDSEMAGILNTIIRSRGLVDSSAELTNTLEYLADNIAHTLEAACCHICVMNAEQPLVCFSSRTGHDFLPDSGRLKQLEVEEGCVLSTAAPEGLFPPELRVCEAKIFPLVSKGEQIGCLLLGYTGYRHTSQQMKLLLSTFAQDILIAIETNHLAHRSVLLQESDHRIKNNLQMIVGLLYMQKQNIRQSGAALDSQAMLTIINDIVSRIKSISLIHDTIANRTGSSVVDVRTILTGIVDFYHSPQMQVEVLADDISLPYNRATTIALLVNELLSNCQKHAFKGTRDNRVQVICRSRAEDILLVIQDNGVGMSDIALRRGVEGVGLQIVHLILGEMGGSVQWSSRNGTRVEAVIPKSSIYESDKPLQTDSH